MKRFTQELIMLFCLLGSTVIAVQVSTISTMITEIEGYTALATQSGRQPDVFSGDILLKVADQNGLCRDGFWIDPADSRAKAHAHMALTAFQLGNKVMLYGDSTAIWQGAKHRNYCRLSQIVYQS